MARTRIEIENEMIAAKVADANLAGLSSTSATAIWRRWIVVVASAIVTLENLWEQFKVVVLAIIDAMKPHSERWYAEKTKAFRYGFNLIQQSDRYDDTGLTPAQIAASQIVAQAAVEEQTRGIRIKVAKLVGLELDQLINAEMLALVAYMKRVKDAGVKVIITTGPADSLKLKVQAKFNPLVLNASGQRIDGTDNEPVQKAIDKYLKNLPFNGVLELDKLVDTIQLVEGVNHAYILEASARYGALAYTSFTDGRYTPDAGYLKLYSAGDLLTLWIAD